MTADSLQKELSKGWAMLVFQYHGKEGHVDPYGTQDGNFSYLLWYDGDEKLVHSMEDVMHTPIFDGHSLSEIAGDISEIDWC